LDDVNSKSIFSGILRLGWRFTDQCCCSSAC